MDKCPEHSAHDQHLDRLDARVLELEDANKELSRFTERITVLVDKYDETLDDTPRASPPSNRSRRGGGSRSPTTR